MVECESCQTVLYLTRIFVLIDTWWNVNENANLAFMEIFAVLIDTWWNVNRSSKRSISAEISVLIDTWWNVNQEFVDSLLKISEF